MVFSLILASGIKTDCKIMKQQIILRQEQSRDFEEVFTVHSQAFGSENEARLVNNLRNNLKVFLPELSIVALLNDKIVGHILFTRIVIDKNGHDAAESLALAPVAVAPAYQKMGIGSKLINKGLEVAAQTGFRSVIVLGHENYYPKFGFLPAEKWDIKAPFDVPSNVFMAIELVKDGLKNISGTVVYPREFETE